MKNPRKYLLISVSFNIFFAVLIILLGFRYVKNFMNNTRPMQQVDIIMFGNSITAYGDWNNLLQRQDVLNKGFPGYTSSHLALMVDEHIITNSPKACFIMVGINDILLGNPRDRIESNFVAILNEMIENKIETIVQSVLYIENSPGTNTIIDSLNNFLFTYCKHNSIQYLDINSKLSNTSGLLPENSLDGIHLTNHAYKIWAKEIQKNLQLMEAKTKKS